MGDARRAARGGAVLQPVRSAFWAAPASTLERAQRPPPAGLSAVSRPALSRPALSRPTLSGAAAVSGSALSGAGPAGPSGGRAIAAIASARGRRRAAVAPAGGGGRGGRPAPGPAPAAGPPAARRYLAAAGR